MKRTSLLFVFLVLVALLAATQGTIRLGQTPNAVQLMRSSDDGLSIRYAVEALDYNEIETPNGTYTDLSIRDYAYTNITGMPRLPLIRQIISVPERATVQFELKNAQTMTTNLRAYGLENPILPRQESVAKCEDASSIEMKINEAFYAARGWTGYEIVAVEELGHARGERLFAVDFSPVRYNPASGEIEVTYAGVLEISFIGADHAATADLKARTWSPVYNSMFKASVLNFREDATRTSLNRHPLSYVVITPSSFVSALQPFIDWKKVEGYNMIVATTEQIGTSANQIKTYLQGLWSSATAENPAPSYVLFVGDVAQIPANTGTTASHVTDLTYVRLQGTDHIPEMYYGRFSATTAAEVTNIVNKTLMYEQYTMPDDTYLSKVVLIAGVDSSWSTTHANGQINYGTTNYFNASNGIVSNTYLYPASGSSASQIVANASEGRGYLNYTAHGSETSWYEPSFTISNVNSLQNTDKYSVVVGNCCVTNAFNTSVCFGEAWLRGQNKGAVAYIGGTNNTYWDEDYYWGVGYKPPVVGTGSPFIANRTGAYDAMFHSHNEAFADWASNPGSTIFMGNMAVVASNSSRINYYWEIYSVMGDPSLGIYLGIPPVNNANVAPTAFIGMSSMEMTVEPYTYAALSMNGVLHGVGLADAQGNLTLSYTPFTEPGTAKLVLTRSRLRPTFINIDVVPNEGPYVMVSSVVVNDGNNAIAEAGETINLDLNLSNVGIQNATSLTATISTGNPYVSFQSTTANLPNVNAGGTAVVNSAFTVMIDPLIPDQTSVVFDIAVTDGTNIWNSTRTIVVNAPHVQILNVGFQDGNGNGFNESGETITVSVNLQNTGHMTAEGGTAVLYLGSTQATLGSTSFVLPGIPAEQVIPISFTVTLAQGIADGTMIPIGLAYTAGTQMLNHTILIPVGVIAEGFESNSFTTFPWINNSSSPWTLATGGTNVHSGNYAAKSGAIPHNGNTVLQITLNVGADGNISFWRKVSSESGYDWLKFSIDNQELGSWAGTQDWTQFTYPVTAGTRTFKWTYSKDVSYTSGSDCAWIDDIVFPMSGSSDIAMLYLPVTELAYGNVMPGETVSRDFTLRNLGNIAVTGSIASPAGFTLSSMGSLLPSNYNYSLEAGQTKIFSLSYDATEPTQINESIVITSNDLSNPVQTISVSLQVVDNDDPTVNPVITKLVGNYPNPFNPETSIRFSLREAGNVSLRIYNLRGQLVRTLINSNYQSGNHTVVWNGRDNNGNSVSSGIYMYRMESPGYNKTLRMMLVK